MLKKNICALQIQHDKGEHHHTVWHCECTEVFPGWSSNWLLLGGSELPRLALKTLNHFETGVWRHLPQSKALMASNTSVKRRRFWNLTTDASASGWTGAMQRLRGDSNLNKWMLEFPWSCNSFCPSVYQVMFGCSIGGGVMMWIGWFLIPKKLCFQHKETVLPRFILKRHFALGESPQQCSKSSSDHPLWQPSGESSVRVMENGAGACVGTFWRMLKAWLGRFGLCRLRGGSAEQHVPL